MLWSELDLLKSEENNPALNDFEKAVFPTPQLPSKRTEILTAGFEVGTSCLANASLCPVARSLSNSSAISLCPYFNAVISALILSEFLISILQPAAHKHLKNLFVKYCTIGLWEFYNLTTLICPFFAAKCKG